MGSDLRKSFLLNAPGIGHAVAIAHERGCGIGEEAGSMLKILRSVKNEPVILTLIGRIEQESLAELKRVVGDEAADHPLILDLKDVTLVDQAAVRFLARCEAESIVLEECPPYIRDWITAERTGRQRRSL